MPDLFAVYDNKNYPEEMMEIFARVGLNSTAVHIDDLLKKHQSTTDPDLLFVDMTRFGAEHIYMEKLKKIYDNIPFIISHVNDQVDFNQLDRGHNVIDFIGQPISALDLSNRILLSWNAYTAALGKKTSGVAGNLQEQNLVDILKMFAVSEKSGITHINTGTKQGDVFFEKGEVIDAQFKSLSGEDALNKMFLWESGNFNIEFMDVNNERKVKKSTPELIAMGKERLSVFIYKISVFPDRESKLYAITRFDPKKYSSQVKEIFGFFKIGKPINTFLTGFAGDELEAVDTLAALFHKKELFLVDSERNEADEQNKGLTKMISRLGSLFKKEEEAEQEAEEKKEDSKEKIHENEYQLRFAKAQLMELNSLIAKNIEGR